MNLYCQSLWTRNQLVVPTPLKFIFMSRMNFNILICHIIHIACNASTSYGYCSLSFLMFGSCRQNTSPQLVLRALKINICSSMDKASVIQLLIISDPMFSPIILSLQNIITVSDSTVLCRQLEKPNQMHILLLSPINLDPLFLA